MKHNGNISLKILDEEGYAFFEPDFILRIENYKKSKLEKMNKYGWKGLPNSVKLYYQNLANMSAVEEFGIELESTIKFPIDVNTNFELRWYQERPLNELLTKPYGLLHADVAFGKTFCIGRIIQYLKGKTVIMCNTQINAEQCAERLKTFFGKNKVGLFYSHSKEFNDITVVVYNSYEKFLNMYNGQFDILIQDECDLLTSNKFIKLTILTNCQYKYGLTGTPYSDRFLYDDFKLWWGEIIDAYEYRENLIGQFNFNIYGVEVGKDNINFKDYNDLKRIIYEDRSIIEAIDNIVNIGRKKNCKILILTDRVDFSIKLGNSLNIPVLVGELSKKTRKIILEEFEEKKVLISIQNIIGRGYDDPEIDMIIVVFGGRSKARIIQSLGRGLRQKDGKDDVYVYDIIYNNGLMKSQWKNRKAHYQEFTDNIEYLSL